MQLTESEGLPILDENDRHGWWRRGKDVVLDLVRITRGERGKYRWGKAGQGTELDYTMIKIQWDTEGQEIRELKDKAQYEIEYRRDQEIH